MINNEEDFIYYVGETIRSCQMIEHDIKLIYAAMNSGDMDQTFDQIKKEPLGNVLHELKRLDHSDGDPYFTDGVYKLLFQIKNIRNHWVHEGFCKYMYSGDKVDHDFQKQARRLENDHNLLGELAHSIQGARNQVLNDFGR